MNNKGLGAVEILLTISFICILIAVIYGVIR